MTNEPADDATEPVPAGQAAGTADYAGVPLAGDAPSIDETPPASGAATPPPAGGDPDVPPAGGAGGFPPPGSTPPPGSAPPPGGGWPPAGGAPGFPPPGGWPPPPPGTGGYATRFGLVRPVRGRVFAGVCGAIGRATNTDPVLWRVLFAVLTLVGGAGLLAYVIGWLLIPGEGDTGSPLESLFGRGRSSTSPALVIVIGVITAIALSSVIYNGLKSSLVLLAVIVGAIVLSTRGGLGGNRTAGGTPPPTGWGGSQPGAPNGPAWQTTQPGPPWQAAQPGPAWQTAPTAPPWQATQTGPAWQATQIAPSWQAATTGQSWQASQPVGPTTAEPQGTDNPPAGAGTPAADYQAGPRANPDVTDSTGGTPPPYRPPFAPHGPYASPHPYPGLGAPGPIVPTRPLKVRERSRLGRITLSAMLLVIGVLAVINVAGGHIHAPGFMAAALATVGLGLLVGAWRGRTRLLIPLGIVLSILLLATSAADSDRARSNRVTSMLWQPMTVSELERDYGQNFGDVTLDLSQIDFTGATKVVDVRVSAGDLTVLLPPKVDVVVQAKVNVGNSDIFDNSASGINLGQRTITNDDEDGPGGGSLTLHLTVNAGNLEVSR